MCMVQKSFAPLLDEIEAGIGAAPNRTRHAMNQALISIGCRPGWMQKAIAGARRIGKVEVDYGQTSCKVNDAEAKAIAGSIERPVLAGGIIEEMIAGFGRRRSPERAALHTALARVAQARGDADAALEQLETASKMDISNTSALKALADEGELPAAKVGEAIKKYGIDPEAPEPWTV